LTELLTVVAIVSILMVLVVPAMKSFIDRRATLEAARSFMSATRLTKSEAMKRGEQVTLCARRASAAPACLTEGVDWSGGWLVFVDRGTRGEFENDADLLIADHLPASPTGPVLATLRAITFRPTGVQLSLAARLQFLPPGASPGSPPPETARLVCVNKPGRARLLSEGATRC